MRATLLGLLVGVLVAAVAISAGTDRSNLYAQRLGGLDAQAPSGDGLTALLGPVVENQQLVVLIDQQRQTMGTYHVQVESGQISLRSVRNFRWDLQMDEFNGAEPLPEKIQALLRTRSLQPERDSGARRPFTDEERCRRPLSGVLYGQADQTGRSCPTAGNLRR